MRSNSSPARRRQGRCTEKGRYCAQAYRHGRTSRASERGQRRTSAPKWTGMWVGGIMVEKYEVVVEMIGQARETDQPATAGFIAEKDVEPHHGKTTEEIKALQCSSGHLRRKTVNGICYCQMCCNGEWYYYYWETPTGRDYQNCGEGARNVTCNDRTYMISC